MAQKVIVELVDDIDGRPIPEGLAETIEFAIDGVGYAIDLGPRTPRPSARLSTATSSTPPEPGDDAPMRDRPGGQTRPRPAIREWARANGYEIADRGRIPTAIVQAHHDAD